MSRIGEKISTLRANMEWTQSNLAKRLCVVPATISNWERNINEPDIAMIQKLSKIFFVPKEKLLDDDYDFPEYVVIDSYLPYEVCRMPEELQDQIHTVYDADLADEGYLHRYIDAAGNECSAIYRAGQEVWWHYREHEPRMIRDWNMEHSK